MRYLLFPFLVLLMVATACEPEKNNRNDDGQPWMTSADSLAIAAAIQKGDLFKFNDADSALFYYRQISTITEKLLASTSKDDPSEKKIIISLLHGRMLHQMGLAYIIEADYSNALQSLLHCQLTLEQLPLGISDTSDRQIALELSVCYTYMGVAHPVS